jgi:hypothetical protein
MLITAILIVWLTALTLVVCVCRVAAGSETVGRSCSLAFDSIGERLVLEHARTEQRFASRRPVHCRAPDGRRLTMRRLRSATHADG